MARDKIRIEVNPGSLTIRYEVSSVSPHGRFYAGALFLAFALCGICFVLFMPGKHGSPSMWDDLHSQPLNSFGFYLAVSGSALLLWYVARAARIAYPGDHELKCDRETMTVSWVRWLDWKNRSWVSESYLMSDVLEIRYGVILRGRGGSIDGLRFRAAGKDYRLFPQLTTNEAGKILAAFEDLGADTKRKRKSI